MRFIIKSKVQHPGKRGGKFWIDKKGEIQYGEKPNARQAKSKNKPVIKKNRIEPEEYKKHGIPEDAKHALSYEGHDKYVHEWRDSKGRLQRRYRPEFVAKKQADKYKRITNAINRIPELREAVNNDINGKDTLKKFTALAIKIMDLTGARVGNEKYTEDNETHGITTLEKSNVTFRNNVAVLNYVGKKGVQQTHEVDQPEVVSALRELKKMPGKRLFEIDEKGNISSDGVNKYLKEYGLTAKDLRTFRANVEFTKALMTGGRPKDDKGRKTAVANALKSASDRLGNTPDVCRTNYISPEILEGYLRGRLSLKFAIAKSYDVKDFDELFDSDEMAFLELWSEATAEGSEEAEGAEGAEGEKPEGDKPVLEKSHVKGHVRATKTGKVVPVRDYENRKRKQNNTNLIDKFAKQSFENVKHQINEPNFKQLSKEKQKEVIINAKIRFKNEAANFIDTIIKKDCDKIFSGILHPRNKKHRAWFTELTGIKMPSTLEETNKTLIKYVGENNHTQYLEKKRIEKEEQSNKYLLENALAEITRPHKIRYNGTIFNTTKEFIDYRLKEGNYKVDKTVKGIKPIYKIRDKDGDGWMPISSKNERIYIDSVLSKRKIRKSIHYFIKSQVAGHQRVTEMGKVAYVRPYQNSVIKQEENTIPVIQRDRNASNVPLEMIERDESQPREEFDPELLKKLGESIKKIGLMQPIGLRPIENGKHKIIFGERRWRAAKLAGLVDIPARVFDITDKKELYAIQVAENLARADMNPIETANAYKKLHDVGMGNEEIAERIGVSPLTVQRKMSLTTLIPEIQKLVKTGDLTETNGILIGQAGLQSAYQFEVLKKITASTKKLTRDELDGIVSRYQTAQNQTSLFGMAGADVITGTSQINKNKVEAVKKQIANLLGNVVKAAEKIINNKNYKIAPAILKEQGKLAHTKEELKLLQNYLGTIVRELEAADAFFHSGGTVQQYLSKQNVKKETRKRIRKAIYLIKSIVKQHTRTSKTGKMVQVGQYVNKKTKRAEPVSSLKAPKDYDEVVKRYGEITGASKADIPKSLSDKCRREKPGSGGEIHLSKKEVTTLLRHGIVGFISAGTNPNSMEEKKLSDNDIKAREKHLRDDLVKQGLKFVKVTGKYGEVEDSYMVMVPNVKDKELIELGKRYNQDSVIYSDHGKNKLIFTTGENAGKSYNGNGFQILNNDAEDFYTEVATKKGKLRFSLKFDFSKLAKSIRYLIKGKVFPVGHVSIYRDGTVWKKIKDTGQSDDWKELVDAEKTKALKKVTGSVSSKGAPIKTVRTLRKEGGKVVQTEKVSGRNRTTVEENKTHKDVGVKVGGAKKDIWAQKVRLGELLSLADVVQIENEDSVLADKLVIKENLWKKPDIEEMKNQGMSAGAAYMVNWTYNTIKSKPEPEYRKEYPIGLSNVSKMILNVKSVEDYKSFYLAVGNMIPYKMGDSEFDAESHKYKIVNTPEVRRQFEALGQSFFENFYTKRRSADYYKFKSHYTTNMSKSYRYALHDAKEFETNNDWGWADIQSEKRDKADLSGAIVEKYIKIIKNNKRLHDIAYWTAVNSPNAKGWNFASHIASNWVYGKMKGIREDLYKYKSVLSRKYHDKKENFDWYLDYKSEELGGVLTAFEFETYKKKVEKYRTKNAEYGENIPASIYKNAGFEHDKWRGEEVRKFSSETNDPEFNLMNEFRKAGITDPIAFTKAAYKWRIDSIPEKDVPTVMKRKGPAVGGGDEKSIHKRFGLRGIEYGNYVDDESREYHSNQCTMAFADLARILKISEKDVSFNGRLAIGFGTRGTGTANATYHPDRKIINITKNRGGGSLAHEWSHFFDNIMGERSGKLYAFASEGELNNQPEIVQEAYRNLNNSINCVIGADHEIYHGKSSIASWGGIDTFIENNNNDATKTYQAIFNYYRNVKSDDKETRARLAEYIAKKCGEPCVVKLSPAQRIEQPSEFRKRSEKCGTYWSKKLEMFARAFSCYIEDKLESRGEYNTYLLRNTKKDLDTGGYFYPYPVEKERKTINKAFDELFRVIRDSKELKKSIFGQGE